MQTQVYFFPATRHVLDFAVIDEQPAVVFDVTHDRLPVYRQRFYASNEVDDRQSFRCED